MARFLRLVAVAVPALLIALPLAALVGRAVGIVALIARYRRDHLDQVPATVGLIPFSNEHDGIVRGPPR